MNRFCCALSAIAAAVFFTFPCAAALIVPQWNRPVDDVQAAAERTTFQNWDVFDGVVPGNAPDVAAVNPNGAPDAFDAAAPASGSFVTSGGNIYSPVGIIQPRVLIPLSEAPADFTRFLVQVEVFGAEIDTADLRINGILASDLPGYTSIALSRTIIGEGGPGSGALVQHAWTFQTPAAAPAQIDFGWGVSSASLSKLLVDTQSANTPEPASFAGLAAAAAVLLARRPLR